MNRQFNPGQVYPASDGRDLFIMSGCNDELDVWQVHGVGRHSRVGIMSTVAFAALLA